MCFKGAKRAKAARFPYMDTAMTQGFEPQCGGALFDPWFVLIAAKCVKPVGHDPLVHTIGSEMKEKVIFVTTNESCQRNGFHFVDTLGDVRCSSYALFSVIFRFLYSTR